MSDQTPFISPMAIPATCDFRSNSRARDFLADHHDDSETKPLRLDSGQSIAESV